jgi:hypothetical protein
MEWWTIIPLGIAVAGGYFLGAKRKIHQVRVLLDEVDDAIQDDRVTEEEFRRIWNRTRNLIFG